MNAVWASITRFNDPYDQTHLHRAHALPQEAGHSGALPKVARIAGMQGPRAHGQVARAKGHLQEVPQRHRCRIP